MATLAHKRGLRAIRSNCDKGAKRTVMLKGHEARLTGAALIITILVTCFPGETAAADSVVFVGPHWAVERYDVGEVKFRTRPGLYKVLTTPNITFDVVYEDNAGQGFFHTTLGAQRQARLEDALLYVSNVVNITGELEVRVEPSLNVASGTLASAGTFFSSSTGFTNGTAFTRLTSGTKPFVGFPEIRVIANFGYNWNISTSPPAFNQFDFLTVLVHELTHGLGFLSLANSTGASLVGASVYSKVDSRIVRITGMKTMFSGTPPTFKGTVADLTSRDLGLNATNATALYDQGVLPGIYAPNPFSLGSSLAHWDTGNIVGGAIMEHAFPTGLVMREYAPVDLGALRDIGYTGAVEADPAGGGGGGGGGDVDVTVTVQLRDSVSALAIRNASVRLDPTDEVFTSNTNGNYSFKITQTGTYKVSVTATGYKAAQSGNFSVTDVTTQVTVPLQMEAFPSAKIGVTPNVASTYDFGSATPGSVIDADFTISNTGGGQVSGTASISGAGFQISSNPNYLLGQGNNVKVTLRFAPPSAGSFSGTATFTGGANGPVSFQLAGTGQQAQPPPSDGGGCGVIAPDKTPWDRAAALCIVLAALCALARRAARTQSVSNPRQHG